MYGIVQMVRVQQVLVIVSVQLLIVKNILEYVEVLIEVIITLVQRQVQIFVVFELKLHE